MSPRLPEPTSPIAPHIMAFVCHKRALNRRYDVENEALRMFDGYLNAHAHGLDQVVDRAGRDPLDVGLLDDGGQRLLGHAARSRKPGK